MTTILDRVKTRLEGRIEGKENLIEEFVTTAKDRICLRVSEGEFPESLDSIAVDVVVKAFNRQYFEGLSSESADSVNTSFVEDIISEYSDELKGYKDMRDAEKRKLRFI